jgi:hypothetical protein
MVEAMANSVEDYLIEGLSFKLNPGASYVIDRRNVSYFTAGSNIYQAGSGTRVIRINITGEGWMDPSTARLCYTLRNNDGGAGHVLRPIAGPHSFFRRVRCLVGGAIVDDIDFYHRVYQMLDICTSTFNRDNNDTEGFGYRWDSTTGYNGGVPTVANFPGIPAGSYRPVSFKPLLGLFSQTKFIPLMWCPLTIELEIVGAATDAIVDPSGGETTFTADNTSTDWQIEDVRLVCDVVSLDSALQNSYAEHVLSGKALPINYNTYISILQSISPPVINVNITRAVSRLKSLFITFDTAHVPDDTPKNAIMKDWNSFVHPMAGTYNVAREMEWQVQIGSKLIPEYPCRSLAQTFYELKKCLGISSTSFHNISPTYLQYMNEHFIIGVDTEKIIEAGFTGLSTRAGDIMTVRAKGANGTLQADFASRIYIILHSDQILEIRDTGAQVFD